MIAATVGDEVISVAEVDERMRVLYDGPLAARLPHPASPEGRNLRRWLVQLMTMERVVAQECDVQGEAVPATLPLALRTGEWSPPSWPPRRVRRCSPASRPTSRRRRCAPITTATATATRARSPRNRRGSATHLVQARREVLFARWLERRHREKVTLMPGFEHPGDPRQPDATHRH